MPSEIMVKQKGHAVHTVCAPVASASLVRFWLIRVPMSSSIHILPPPAPQQKLFAWWFSISTSAPEFRDVRMLLGWL